LLESADCACATPQNATNMATRGSKKSFFIAYPAEIVA
jgi:hypothetical protein